MLDDMENLDRAYADLQRRREQRIEQESKNEEPIIINEPIKDNASANKERPIENAIVEHKDNAIVDTENVIIPDINNKFSSQMDDVKIEVLKDASETDKQFVDSVKENIKHAAVKHTEVEVEKAEFAKQTIKYEQEKLSTKQTRNANEQAEDIWDNRQKRRQFHFNGVKPIMEFVGIKEPMNLIMLYGLTIVLLPFFLLAKLWKGTIGAIIAGAEDTDRPKAIKGFLWTLLGLIALLAIALLIYFFLKWQHLI